MSQIKVEIGNYRTVDKGMWKASFSLLIHPQGQKILDCKYFEKDNNEKFFAFPSKEVKYQDGRKTDYFPIVSYLNKEYLEQLKFAVMEALKEHNSKDTNAKTNTKAPEGKKSVLPDNAPNQWGDCPF